MDNDEQALVSTAKTCPMCAEEVKTAAVICRFCGYRFDGEPTQQAIPAAAPPGLPIPPRPEGSPPEMIAANLRPGETVLSWSPCFLNYAAGTLAVTTDRLMFTMVDQTPVVDHRINVERRVNVGGGSPTMPVGCRPDGTVVVEFADQRADFHGMNPDLAKEIAATIVPSLIEQLYADDLEAKQALRGRQQTILARSAVTAPKAVIKVGGCKFLGGITCAAGTGLRGSLTFSPDAIEFRAWGKTGLTVSRPKAGGVSIEGAEQLQQRLTATRMIGLGVFSLAAPKSTHRATSYITLSTASGETGIFEVKDTPPMALRAQLSPWLAEH